MKRAALLACGLAVAAAPAAFAAGEQVDTTVKLKKGSKITKKKPGLASLSWAMEIATADGSRARSLHQAELTLPSVAHADTKGLAVCPLATLEANDNKSCPKKSVVGDATSHILTPEVRAEPYGATGIIYFTGKKGKNPTFGVYYTLTEIPSLHSVSQLMVTKKGKVTKLYMDQPPVPVPGLPDATPLDIALNFSKGKPFRLSSACKKNTSVAARYGFYDQSPASHDNSVFHTSIASPVKTSTKAC